MIEVAIADWLHDIAGISPLVQGNLLQSAVAVAALWIVRWLAVRYLLGRIDDPVVRYRTRKILGYFAALIGIIVVGRIWYAGIGPLATYLGLLSAGLAIALRELIANVAGWLFIVWRRPFDVGDRVQVGDTAGDVIDLRIFQFSLLEIGNWVNADQTTGRIIHVPNAMVFTQPLANYNRGITYIWNEIPVLVTFESDWQSAKMMLNEIIHARADNLGHQAALDLRRASSNFLLGDVDLNPRVYTSLEESGVLLTLRYLCNPRQRRSTAEHIWEDILRAFASREDIDFAYPTTRLYDNRTEGKPEARAAASLDHHENGHS